MTDIEKLKKQREEEAIAYLQQMEKVNARREKQKVQEDIRRIRAAKLRAKYGFIKSAEIKSAVGKTGKMAKVVGEGLMKFLSAIGEHYEEMEQKEKKMRKKTML